MIPASDLPEVEIASKHHSSFKEQDKGFLFILKGTLSKSKPLKQGPPSKVLSRIPTNNEPLSKKSIMPIGHRPENRAQYSRLFSP
ncbi:hypothetical protein JTE90_029603 [Oedothorax gibbosus]|uniref:Uncharacterized protein n=1 Tax=Oedothorax gibbosus TaxID=931172 RepID=A0AAV6UV14_9ARAC|nr:hypothetical protein JTE90_029603 [Oedothorax gibbosus]